MRLKKHILHILCTICLLSLAAPLQVFAETFDERIDAQRAMPVETNEIENWPQGPIVTAESAILIDAETGTILYAKNIHKAQYPASTTKILTTLIAAENCQLDETVTFSKRSVFSIPAGSNHVAMDVGNTLSMEQCLNAILIRSANEVAYAVSEHIGGSFEGFAEMMNKRATELGCVDSNFVNPNGLPDEEHYTSAYDLAKIGQAFFANEMLCKITTTERLIIPKGEKTLIENNKMDLLPGHKYAYPYLVGCKTGYTIVSRYALVACAEKNGMKLISVVLKDETPAVYEDTIALLDYGFANFEKVNIAQVETRYNIDNIGLFYDEMSLFDTKANLLCLDPQATVIIPKTVPLEELTTTISYDTDTPGQAALITYSYQGLSLGTVSLNMQTSKKQGFAFDSDLEETDEVTTEPKPSFIFINVIRVFIVLVMIAAIIGLFFFIKTFRENYHIDFLASSNRKQRHKHSQEIREAKHRYRRRNRKRRGF